MPAPVPSFCDHRSSQDSQLRSSIVVARLGACYGSQSTARLTRLRIHEIAPAPKGFSPAATTGLGCAVQINCREFPVSNPGVLTDAHTAIS